MKMGMSTLLFYLLDLLKIFNYRDPLPDPERKPAYTLSAAAVAKRRTV